MICPVCKAANSQGTHCRRCRADLTPLFALEAESRRLMVESGRAFCGGDWAQALRRAEVSEQLRRGAESLRMQAACHLLQRDFVRAWQAYGRARERTNPSEPEA